MTENEMMQMGLKMMSNRLSSKTKLAKIFLLFLGCALFINSESVAKEIPQSPLTGMKISYESKEGLACMAKQVGGGQADKTLQRFGVTTEGPTFDGYYKGTATAMSRIADLGRPDLVQGIKIELHPDGRINNSGKKSCASFTYPKVLKIVAGSGSCGRNVHATGVGMHILHEMGHSVGLRGGLYASFQRVKCPITGYCTHNDSQPGSEAFAESFALFVHSPNTLKSTCPAAYDFIKQNVFRGRDSTAGICSGIPSTAIAGGTTSNPPASTASFGGGSSSTRRGYNGGSGTQLAGLGETMAAAFAMLTQQNQKTENANPEVLGPQVIPRQPAQIQRAHPTSNGMPGGTVR